MARRRNYNRHRRGRFTFLYKVLSIFAICVVIVVALTLFFRINSIIVTGGERYSTQEIIEATGLENGDNLSLLNKYAIAEDLQKKLPYIVEVRINREFPDTLTIDVTEGTAAAAVVQDGVAWLISPHGRGKIVEQRTAAQAADIPKIEGVELLAPSVASPPALAADRSVQQESLLALLKALDEAGMLGELRAISLKDLSVLEMDYTDRFRVELPYGADYAYKLRVLQSILDSGKIESNEVGTIRMTGSDGQNLFIKG